MNGLTHFDLGFFQSEKLEFADSDVKQKHQVLTF